MRRASAPACTWPQSYLQVVTFFHIEMQPVLQLLQVSGLLQDTLSLAKSLQPTCFTTRNHHDSRLACPQRLSLLFWGGRVSRPQPLESPYPSWLYFWITQMLRGWRCTLRKSDQTLMLFSRDKWVWICTRDD